MRILTTATLLACALTGSALLPNQPNTFSNAISSPATDNPQNWPGARWWWMGSAVDSTGIEWSLRQYADAGLRSVEITPIYGVKGNENSELNYLSPEWMNIYGYTCQLADSLGIIVDMNQGTGWPFGGPEVDIMQGACCVECIIDTVNINQESTKSLPAKKNQLFEPKLIAQSRRNLDDGRQEIIKLYESRTQQQVKRAAPGGEGLVIDHLDKNAVAQYFNKFDSAFTVSGQPYPHSFFCDSYEVFGANWTPSLPEEFAKRHGYRIEDKLPELLGTVDDGNQVLCDYRQTMSELLFENFVEQWVDWAHAHGTQVRNQAHGSPANLIDCYATADVPEIEGFGLSDFGIKGLRKDDGNTRPNDSDMSMLKYASSAAHIAGKPLTSSETCTWLTEHFRTSLSQIKPDIDLLLTSGVNRIFFHGATYSPPTAQWPGWKFYASVDMTPTNSIWRDAPALFQYIARCQQYLQDGKPDNDFLVYLPIRDLWQQRLTPGINGIDMHFSIHKMKSLAPDFINTISTIDSLGYDCDYISDRFLLSTTWDGSQFVTPGGTHYKGLIIPGSGNLDPKLQAHIDNLKAAGANITYSTTAQSLASMAMPETIKSELGLHAIRRRNVDGYTYFISNLSPNDIDTQAKLTVPFVQASLINPIDGEEFMVDAVNNSIPLQLLSGASVIVRTYDSPASCNAPKLQKTIPTTEINIAQQPWTLHFSESMPAVEEMFNLDSLKPWTDINHPVLATLAGTGVYSTDIEVPATEDNGFWSINLGDLRESARVYIDDELIGTAWSVPFQLKCPTLTSGKHNLRIEVTNLPANHIAELDRQNVEWRNFKDINIVDIHYKRTGYAHWDTMPSGLNSTVTLSFNKIID